jgi:dipeptidyl aminopeptidase/acylaminoacyl peptidase
MKRLFVIAVLVGLATGLVPLASADLPPIIDRQLFFGDPQISGAQISPDGQFISFIKPYKDERNVWVKKRDEAFDAAHPVTADNRPVTAYFWSRDSHYILYVQDKGGNENFHVYAVDPGAAADAGTGVPPARDLTPLDNIRAIIYSVPENTPGTIIVGLNDRDATYHDLYKVAIATGERTMLMKNEQKVGQWILDRDGNIRLAYRQTEDGGNEILRVDGTNLTPIYSVSYLESADPVGFNKDMTQVYIQTNKGAPDLTELELLDPATGKTQFVEKDPENQVDFGNAMFSEKTHELIATSYTGDRTRYYPKTAEAKQDFALMKKKLPDGEYAVTSATLDEHYYLVAVYRDVDPGSVYLYDRQKGSFSLLYRSRPDLPSENLAEMKPVTYTSRDGLTIPAYLTLPKGVPAKNLPVIINPHGGPWARDVWGYNPYAQFLANRGYAVLQPNFRASTGYGKKFLNAGNHEWGTGAMQNDLTDGVQYLIKQGIADPKRVCIFGGSYGGYATLAGVTYTPDLYACAIPYCAPSNLVTLIESFPAYWKPFLKGSWYMRVGDPENEADRADLIARSPLFKADQIKCPLLVVHGANDPRVKKTESDQIVAALRDKGKPVEYIVAPDEGHGFRSADNRMALAVAMEKFLAKYLGGRAQEDVPTDLAQHLSAVTVDVASVTLPAKADDAMLASAQTGPLPTTDGSLIKAGTFKYAATMEVGTQKMSINVSRTIVAGDENGRKCWKVVDTAEIPGGKQIDTFSMDAKTLEPVARHVDGPGQIDLAYSPKAITGQMGAMGQKVEVNQSLTAPVLADGPGLELTVSALPLAEGYTTAIRYFDPMTQKVRAMQLTVTGKTQVQVAGGSFDTFVVDMKPLDGDDAGKGTLNVMEKGPHNVVRSVYKLPAMMGGGMLTTELAASQPAKP